jgi:hypothetical protein
MGCCGQMHGVAFFFFLFLRFFVFLAVATSKLAKLSKDKEAASPPAPTLKRLRVQASNREPSMATSMR